MNRFNCCECGQFVGHEKGKIVIRDVAPQDYWNGLDEAVTAYCEKHLPAPKAEAK